MARKTYQTTGYQVMLHTLNNRARAQLGIPGMFGVSKDGQIYVTEAYAGFVGYAAQVNVANMAVKTAVASSRKTVDALTILGRAIALEQAPGSKHIEQANKQLAAKMRARLVEEYGSTVERRKQVPSYPRANRLSGNLRKAITQPDMAVGTANGISYINQDRLNVEARHWARINFGVRGAPGAKGGAAQSKAPGKFTLLGSGPGGRNVGTVGFTGGPRPAMYLPPGFWEFIGGRAPAREQRLGRVGTQASDDDSDSERRDDRLARATARRRARMGLSADPVKASSGSGKISGVKGGHYRSPLGPVSGTSSWGADVGGYARASSYSRRYTQKFFNFGNGQVEKHTRQRNVTRVVRGRRRSRQAFRPTRRGPWYPTRGVVATNFMDSGFKALRDNVDNVYLTMASNMIADATSKAEKRSIKRLLVKYDAKMEINRLLSDPDIALSNYRPET